MKSKVPNKKGVWYYQYITYCVLGGCTEIVRERREGPRPDYPDDREFSETGCYGCQYAMFM